MNSKNDSKLSFKQPHLKPKQKKTKQTTRTWNRNRIREMEITWKVISGEGEEKNGGKGTGKRSIIGRYRIDGKRLKIV